MTTPEQNQQQQPNRQQTIFESKSLFCADVRKIITRPLLTERLLKMVGGDESKLARYMTSFFAVLMSDDGGSEGNKKYYWQCNIQSIVQCFMESVNMGLPFDSRQLVAMIIYKKDEGYEAELDISYKGFVNALNKKYKDAFVECKLVHAADKFKSKIVDRTAHYEYEPADAFAVIDKDFKGIKGGYCYFSYLDTDGQKTSRLVFLSQQQILKNRSRARTKYVWDSDPKAMGEKTCIREGARLPFAAIDLEIDIEAVDNKHYVLEKQDAHSRLTALIEAQDAETEPKPQQGENENAGASSKTDDQNQDNAQGTPAVEAPEGKEKTPSAASPAQNATAEGAADNERTAKPETGGTSQPDAGQMAAAEEGAGAASERNSGAIDAHYEEMPAKAAAKSPASAEAPAHAAEAIWDGETVYMGNGKTMKKDSFTSSQQAAVYLKKVMNNRNHKSSRQDILDGNKLLVEALKRDSNTAILEDLTKLAQEGE